MTELKNATKQEILDELLFRGAEVHVIPKEGRAEIATEKKATALEPSRHGDGFNYIYDEREDYPQGAFIIVIKGA
jgi:hypothetical protein